jgi:phospholipid/cholesterol/gamma-HCH transport system substrate-binding protein
MRRKGRRRGGISTFWAGVIGIVVLVVFTYLAYSKFANPFASKFTVHAVFQNANGLRPQSLVRIAGVNVGAVESVQPVKACKQSTDPACQQANVTMTISDQGLPLHSDATFAIRPRIFLEGNFFIDISPGSPSAPIVGSGHTFPINQGTEPVQFDQVLTSLQADTRKNLQLLLKGYGTAVKKGGSSYNASIRYWLPAYEYSAIVAHDALGLRPHDLSNWIAAQGTVAGALNAHPQSLKSLITDFNTTAGAFARENVALQNTLQELPRTLAAAIPAFDAVNRVLCSGAAGPPPCSPGPVPQLAKTLIPGVKSTGPMVDATLPFISQLRQLVQPSELRGLTADLSRTVPALAKLTVDSIPLFKNGVRPASSCVANVIYPWSQLTLHDKHFNVKNGFPPRKVYVEAVDFLPGLAGESRNFDANGPYIRILGALGNTATQSLSSGLLGGTLQPIQGEQPALPPGGKRPPLQPNVPCETQPPVNDLTATSGPKPPTANGLGGIPLLGKIPLPVGLPLPSKLVAKSARTKLIDELQAGLRQQGIRFKVAPGSTAAPTNTKRNANSN